MRVDHILQRRLPRHGFTYDTHLIFAHKDGAKSIIDAINDVLSIESAAYPSQVILDDCLAEIFVKARAFINQTDKPSLIGTLRSWEVVTDSVSWAKDKVPAYNVADLAEYLVKATMRYLEKAGGFATATNGFAGYTAMAVGAYVKDMRTYGYALPLPTTRNGNVARMNHKTTATESKVTETHGEGDVAMGEASAAAGGAVPAALPLRPAVKRKADDDSTAENKMPIAKYQAVKKLNRK